MMYLLMLLFAVLSQARERLFEVFIFTERSFDAFFLNVTNKAFDSAFSNADMARTAPHGGVP